ncbi:fumarylacetoacetate hydrolase family protein [Variovorax humicola]|uniref:Fumarylacetoacetate hydrolase family protein n=1 Tax=Variovorax humicola TaxID=1769758 RepID=A0ABU8W5C5_9BURK
MFDLLAQGSTDRRGMMEDALVPIAYADLLMPVRIGGYTDFFASVHHATNAGRLFRPDQPLLPNYKYVPVGYNGRAASVQLAHAPVHRPRGQVRRPGSDAPDYLPCERLDYEVELGLFVGRGSSSGQPIAVDGAWDHLFGMCLLNDWSARDVQAWEAQPLGPFLAKSFATGISPWIVTAEALACGPQKFRPSSHLSHR